MAKQEVPQEYRVKGLEATGYNKANSLAEAVDFKTPNGSTFSLARDMMGVQFCAAGRLWPNIRGFDSMDEAIAHIKKHTDEAIAFFESSGTGKSFDVVDVLIAGALAGQKEHLAN